MFFSVSTEERKNELLECTFDTVYVRLASASAVWREHDPWPGAALAGDGRRASRLPSLIYFTKYKRSGAPERERYELSSV